MHKHAQARLLVPCLLAIAAWSCRHAEEMADEEDSSSGPTTEEGLDASSTPFDAATQLNATTIAACTPGSSVACAGPQGCAGFQVCNDEGNAFRSCDCRPASDQTINAAACIAGASIACTGPQGCSGFQVCDREGKGFEPCNCGSIDSGVPSEPGDAGDVPRRLALQGAIQKGPFVVGSSVTMAAIDSAGASTGQLFSTTTADSLGRFGVDLRYSGYLDMAAQGFYYDEVSGGLSAAPIVLRALYDASSGGAQNAFINIVTHLARNRALRLMQTADMSLVAAESQAEAELQSALGIGGTGFGSGQLGSSLDELGADSDPNAYLFAVSATLLQAARDRAGTGPADAELQQLLDSIAYELTSTGALPMALKSELHAAEQHLDVDLSMDLFALRLKSVGSDLAPANLHRAVDSDGDGFRNSIDTCPLVPNATQTEVPTGVICSLARKITYTPKTGLPAASTGGNPGTTFGDLDGDGHVDLLVGSNNSSAYFDDGSGRFARLKSSSYVAQSLASFVFDVNDDGLRDVASNSGWSAGNGGGDFATEVAWPKALFTPQDRAVYFYTGVALADFNHDGLVDVARVADFLPPPHQPNAGPLPPVNYLAISLGSSKGLFAAPSFIDAGLSSGPGDNYQAWISAGDVDLDNDVDLIVTEVNWNETRVIAARGDGLGGFMSASPVTLFTDGDYVRSLGSADFDGDGHLDVAASAIGRIAIAYGVGNGTFSPAAVTTMRSQNFIPSFVTGDFNGDGKVDVAGTLTDETYIDGMQGNAVRLGLLLSLGRTLAQPQLLRTSALGTESVSVEPPLAASDLNGDGISDLVFLSKDTQNKWSIQTYLMDARR